MHGCLLEEEHICVWAYISLICKLRSCLLTYCNVMKYVLNVGTNLVGNLGRSHNHAMAYKSPSNQFTTKNLSRDHSSPNLHNELETSFLNYVQALVWEGDH